MQFGSHRALDALDVTVERGVTGLVGANGAGKTTLMSILLGLRHATAGTAEVLGLDPASAVGGWLPGDAETVMETVSVSVAPSLSVTVRVTVWLPTGKLAVGLTPSGMETLPALHW